MKTGDHKATAVAIAREIGMLDPEPRTDGYPEVLTEMELQALDEATFRETVRHVNVFARLTPTTKLRIVDALRHA